VRVRRTLLPGLAAALAVALSPGCGGGAESTDAPLTRAEWIARADAICADANARIEALGEPKNAGELAGMTEDAVAINDKALASIRALQPPPEIEEQVVRALELSERQNEIAHAIAEAAGKGDRVSVQNLVAELAPLESEARDIAKAIGLEQCGTG
jgi:hypothetical protein